MRYIDITCPRCGTQTIDHFQRTRDENLPLCFEMRPGESLNGGEPPLIPCLTQQVRIYLPTNRGTVIGDDLPGGVLIKNGLCNPDGSPRRYYSKTDINREADKRGYTNVVEHLGSAGSDKSKHTKRWI